MSSNEILLEGKKATSLHFYVTQNIEEQYHTIALIFPGPVKDEILSGFMQTFSVQASKASIFLKSQKLDVSFVQKNYDEILTSTDLNFDEEELKQFISKVSNKEKIGFLIGIRDNEGISFCDLISGNTMEGNTLQGFELVDITV